MLTVIACSYMLGSHCFQLKFGKTEFWPFSYRDSSTFEVTKKYLEIIYTLGLARRQLKAYCEAFLDNKKVNPKFVNAPLVYFKFNKQAEQYLYTKLL